MTEAGETAVHNDEETSVPAEATAPVAEQPKPVPSPALIARRARAGAEQGTSGEQVPEEKTVAPSEAPSEAPKPSAPKPSVAQFTAPKPSVAQFTAPKPTPLKPSAPTPVASAPLETPSETRPAAPKPSAPAVPAAPSPGMFRKATLTYRPPQIEEYLQGLRAQQQAAEQEATPGNIAPDVPNTPAPMPVPSAGTAPATSEVAASDAPSRPAEVTAEDRERTYRIRPGLRQRMEREGLSEDLVRTILGEGMAERVNDWTIRFRYDDYRVDVNTASAELITVVDEYEAECNDGDNAPLAHG